MISQNHIKKVILSLIVVSLIVPSIFAERIPVDGWAKSIGKAQFGDSWKDSEQRTHYVSAKSIGEISIYGESFGFKGKSESEWSLSFHDKHINRRIISKTTWTSEKNPSSKFRGHGICDLTAGAATCASWLKGYGEYDGKILELTRNESASASRENDDSSGPNLYKLEGIVMDEPEP